MQLNRLYHLISAWRFLLHPTSIPFILGRLGRKRSSTATTVGSSLGRRLPRQHLSPSSLVSPGPLEVNTQLGFFKEDGKCFPSMATQLELDLQVLKGGFDVYKLIKFIFSTEGCPMSTEGWYKPKYSRWLSHKVHHCATILRFLPTIWFLQRLSSFNKMKTCTLKGGGCGGRRRNLWW